VQRRRDAPAQDAAAPAPLRAPPRLACPALPSPTLLQHRPTLHQSAASSPMRAVAAHEQNHRPARIPIAVAPSPTAPYLPLCAALAPPPDAQRYQQKYNHPETG
jgi:hypothetical protein